MSGGRDWMGAPIPSLFVSKEQKGWWAREGIDTIPETNLHVLEPSLLAFQENVSE